MKKILSLQMKFYAMDIGESSTSGEITSSFEGISNVFTSYTEIPSNGFNCLFKAQRYIRLRVVTPRVSLHRSKMTPVRN